MIDTSLGFNGQNQRNQTGLSSWFVFAAGGIATLLLVYVGVARPAAQELSLLRQQIQALEKGVAAVAGQRGSVDETNHLLGLLSQQQTYAVSARKALADLRELNSTLLDEASRVKEAMAAVDQLASIKDLVLKNSKSTDKASDALSATEALQNRLAKSATTNELAMKASLDLLAIRNEVLRDSSQNSVAQSALQDLLQIRSTLNDDGSNLELAQDRLTDLIALKDSVLTRSNNLRDSIETLEVTEQIGERFRQATSSFKDMHAWLIEVVAMEPTFAKARLILEPMSEMVDLKRMDPKQLRDFARAFVQQSQDRLTNKPSNMVMHRSSSEESATISRSNSDSTIE